MMSADEAIAILNDRGLTVDEIMKILSERDELITRLAICELALLKTILLNSGMEPRQAQIQFSEKLQDAEASEMLPKMIEQVKRRVDDC